MFRKIKRYIGKLEDNKFEDLYVTNVLLGKLLTLHNVQRDINRIDEVEFKVSSQFGEDGIIQYLVNILPIKNKTFVEFGVEDYSESNTRFLLFNNNWSGLIIDGSEANVHKIQSSNYYWKYDLVATNSFITKENINEILRNFLLSSKSDPEIGILSIDIDGNDYHVWERINCVNPIIVICEYNAVLGKDIEVTIPYDSKFVRNRAHFSNLYFGASIQALYRLGRKKGYEYIGTNSAGNNAFFVREDYAQTYVNALITSPAVDHNDSKFREARDPNGNLTYSRNDERTELIKGMNFVDLKTNEIRRLSEIMADANEDYV